MALAMANVAYTAWNGVVFAAFGSKPADKPEWNGYITFLRRETRARARSVIYSRGSVLESYQRRDLEAFMKSLGKDKRIAVVTPSTFVRGFTKALSLIEPAFRSFSPSDLEAAFEYLEIPPLSFLDAKAVFDDLCTQASG